MNKMACQQRNTKYEKEPNYGTKIILNALKFDG